jgi:hypothetical protein
MLFMATAIAVVGCQPPRHAVGETALEVRWTSALALGSLEKIDQRLAARWDCPLEVRRVSGKRGTAVITNCLSYFDLTRQGFESTPIKYQLVLGADCHALRALNQAIPAQRSHLAGFQLDAEAISDMPPDLSLVISKDDARKVEAANRKGLSWQEFEPIRRITPEKGPAVRVEGDGWGVRIVVYAFGDFNADGLEDMLLKTDGWLQAGTYATTRLLVLTRRRDGGRLKLVTEYDLTK